MSEIVSPEAIEYFQDLVRQSNHIEPDYAWILKTQACNGIFNSITRHGPEMNESLRAFGKERALTQRVYA